MVTLQPVMDTDKNNNGISNSTDGDKLASLTDNDMEQLLHHDLNGRDEHNIFDHNDMIELQSHRNAINTNDIEDIVNPSLETAQSPISNYQNNQLMRRNDANLYQNNNNNNSTNSQLTQNQLLQSNMFRNLMAQYQQQQQQQQQQQPQSTVNTNTKPLTHKSRPAFVNKLWNMINDKNNIELIQWSPDGKSFIVTNREKFVHEILPRYFKHSNFASFVRQLNMYGWHKVQDVKSGSIQNSTDDKWQFTNEYFIKDREDLLDRIFRQKSTPSSNSTQLEDNNTNGNSNHALGNRLHLISDSSMSNNENNNKNDNSMNMNVNSLLGELEQLKYNQMSISKDLLRISKDNELLWKENIMARERHRNQQQALEKILRFLSTLVPHLDQKKITDRIMNDNNNNNNNDFNTINPSSPNSNFIDLNIDNHMNTDGNTNNNMDLNGVSMNDMNLLNMDFDILGQHQHQQPQVNQDQEQPSIIDQHLKVSNKPKYLLKNRSNSSTSDDKPYSIHTNDSSGRISEIPFQEEEAVVPDNDSNNNHTNTSITDEESFLNHLQSNIDEQDVRIQQLEDMVQGISPGENTKDTDSNTNGKGFDLQDYFYQNHSTGLTPQNETTGLTPLLQTEHDLTSFPNVPNPRKRVIEEINESPLVEEVDSSASTTPNINSSSSFKRTKQ